MRLPLVLQQHSMSQMNLVGLCLVVLTSAYTPQLRRGMQWPMGSLCTWATMLNPGTSRHLWQGRPHVHSAPCTGAESPDQSNVAELHGRAGFASAPSARARMHACLTWQHGLPSCCRACCLLRLPQAEILGLHGLQGSQGAPDRVLYNLLLLLLGLHEAQGRKISALQGSQAASSPGSS